MIEYIDDTIAKYETTEKAWTMDVIEDLKVIKILYKKIIEDVAKPKKQNNTGENKGVSNL